MTGNWNGKGKGRQNAEKYEPLSAFCAAGGTPFRK